MQSIQIVPLIPLSNIDIIDLFSAFRHLPGAVLLDSANSSHPDSRFDIFVAEPVVSIQEINSQLDIVSNLTSLPQTEELSAVEQILALQAHIFADTISPESDLPFIVGSMGYFGYDWGRSLENIPAQAQDEYQTPQLQMGIYTWSVIKDNQSNQCYFCYHPNYPHPSVQDLLGFTQPVEQQGAFKLQNGWQSNLTKASYLDKLNNINEYLLAGDCYQINMAQRFSAQYSGDEWGAYCKLREANSAPFSAYLRTQYGAIVSISPERFISVDEEKVETKPIKGTRPRRQDPVLDAKMAKELQESTKDRAENLMIVDLLRNDLSKNCLPGSVEVPKLFAIESFPAVHHLVSTIVGKLKSGGSPLQLLQDAFPGGSITGAPKIRAMQIIEELEPNHRHIYCGSIGYLGIKGDMDSNICIRTLLLESNSIYCWAGGGIVADSDALQEYQETLDKVAKILPVLAQ